MASIGSSKDNEVQPAPGDGVSCLAFSPAADLLAVGAWDNQTRIYDVEVNTFTSSVAARPKCAIQHEAPVLCCAWSADGSRCFSAGADRSIRVMDVATGQQIAVPNAHEQPISAMAYSATLNALLTASHDRTAKWWDLRGGSCVSVAVMQLPERCYALSVGRQHAVFACAERHVCVVNLNAPATIAKSIMSPLKWQTRSVAVYPADDGYALGSIEGRVSLSNFEDAVAAPGTSKPAEFSFKCQRDDALVYAVNCIAFHPVHGTFATAGSDGTYSFWDRDSRQRLKASSKMDSTISATAFSRTGQLFAYAVSYDWSRGVEGSKRDACNAVCISVVKDVDVKPRGAASSLIGRRYK